MKYRIPITTATGFIVILGVLFLIMGDTSEIESDSITNTANKKIVEAGAVSVVNDQLLTELEAVVSAPQVEAKNFIEPLGLATFSGQGIPRADAPMPQQVALRLEDGSELVFELTGKEVRGEENVSWTGEVAGQPGSMVVLTRVSNEIDGYIMTLDRGEIQVAGKVGESLKLERLHLEQGFCGTCAAEHSADKVPAGFQSLEQPAMTGEDASAASEPAAAGANPIIDMLVVYSQRARATVGGTSAMNAKIHSAINSLNNTLANSGVAITIRLVHAAELQYVPGAANDGSVATGLSRLLNPSDGHVDEAYTLRDTYGADLISFVIDETPLVYLGVGYIFNALSCFNADTMTGVAPHEWGHNLGCGHNDSGTGQTNLQGEYNYSYAHYFTYNAVQRGTIMSYIGQRFARFSNPNVNWNGIPTGTAARDHALTMENTKTTIGNWKTASATDLDQDGILDVNEPAGDLDGDGLDNVIDIDSDGDGTLGTDEIAVGRDPYDGKPFFGFATDGDFEGWSSVNVSNKTVSTNWMSGIATSGDSQLPRSGFLFPGSAGSTILVKMQAELNSTAQLFWGNTEADNIVGARSVTAGYSGSGASQVLSLDVSADTNWTTKTITRFRFDPMNTAASANKAFAIDWIAVTDGDFDDDDIADATDGYGDADEDGLPDFADTESDGDGLDDAAELAAGRDHADPGDLAFHFNTNGDFENWHVNPLNMTGLTVSNGVIKGTTTTADPHFENHSFSFLGAQVPKVSMRIRAGANATVQLFWLPKGGGFAGNFVDQAYNGSGNWQVLEFQMAGDANWDGETIDKLRIDPIASSGAWFEIDWVRGVNGDADYDGFTDLVEGAGDSDSDGIDDYLDEDSDNDGFLDWEEFLVGTDRTNASENGFLVAMGGADVELAGKAGRLYHLQSTTNLVVPTWGTQETQGPLPSDQTVTFTNTTSELNEYYRVLVELP